MQSLDAGLGGIIQNELSASHNTELIESNMNGGDLEDMHKYVLHFLGYSFFPVMILKLLFSPTALVQIISIG